MPTIDVFQLPGDVLASTDGQVLRFRLEWRHTTGQTEFFLPASGRELPAHSQISRQLLAVADQMMARVEVSSSPAGAVVGVGARNGARRVGLCPTVLLVPPGALSLEFSLQEKIRRSDTLVAIGGFYEIHADFRSLRIDPQTKIEPPNAWPLWSLTLASVLGGIWAAREQILAQKAYDRLGKEDNASSFSAKWDDLRTANTLRNGFFSAGLVFGIGTAWMEWSNAH